MLKQALEGDEVGFGQQVIAVKEDIGNVFRGTDLMVEQDLRILVSALGFGLAQEGVNEAIDKGRATETFDAHWQSVRRRLGANAVAGIVEDVTVLVKSVGDLLNPRP